MYSIYFLLIIVFLALLTDLRNRTIPNWLIGFGLIGFVVSKSLETNPQWENILINFLLGSLFLILWKFKIFGGGDAKLLWLLGLSVPLSQWHYWLIMVALVGGVAAIFWEKTKPQQSALPYSIAIFGGYLGWFIFHYYKTI